MSASSSKSGGKSAVKKKPPNPFGIPSEEVEEILKKLRTRYITGCRVADEIPPLKSFLNFLTESIDEQELFTKLVVSEELGERGSEVLFTLLHTYPYLMTLCLWRIHCGDRGSIALANYLCLNPLLSHLEIMDCRITEASCDSLGRAFRLNTHIKYLLLDHNTLSDNGIVALFENGLKHYRTLTHLKLKFCGIGDVGARAIAEYLVSGSVLVDLDLQGNKVSSRGIVVLAEALKMSTTLTHLNLAFNEFGVDVMAWKTLFEGVQLSSSLKYLDVNNNTVTDEVGTMILELLEAKESLKTIIISDRIPVSIYREIIKLVDSRNSVKKKPRAKKKSPSKR